MPGFVIHLAEAIVIMESMKKKPDEAWRQDFLLGSLLPDTRLGEHKAVSHFWGCGQEEYIARAPKLSLFLEKYRHRLDEPAILGYYAHLYLDEHYVCRFWPKVLSFEDKNGCIQSKKDKITQVELKHSGEKVPFEKFFSPEYYYGDYTRCNHWFVEKFHIKPPEYRNMELLGMNEVQPEALKDVLEELEYLFSRGCIGDEKWMKVFDLAELEAFVRDTAEAFCRHMEDLMHM